MKTKIKDFIKNSRVLNDDTKAAYLHIVDFLSEERLEEVGALLENENQAVQSLEIELVKEESAINAKYLEKIEKLYKKEFKNAANAQEKTEHDQADEILKELD